MAIKEGWIGRFFEDFEVGDEYRAGSVARSSSPTTSCSR